MLGWNESKSSWLRRAHVHTFLSWQAGHGQKLSSTAALFYPDLQAIGLSLILPANGRVFSPVSIPLVSSNIGLDTGRQIALEQAGGSQTAAGNKTS